MFNLKKKNQFLDKKMRDYFFFILVICINSVQLINFYILKMIANDGKYLQNYKNIFYICSVLEIFLLLIITVQSRQSLESFSKEQKTVVVSGYSIYLFIKFFGEIYWNITFINRKWISLKILKFIKFILATHTITRIVVDKEKKYKRIVLEILIPITNYLLVVCISNALMKYTKIEKKKNKLKIKKWKT
jgi:hypothetical protein